MLLGDRGETLDARARKLAISGVTLSTTARALLAVRTALKTQIAGLDKLLLTRAHQNPAVSG